LPASQLLTYFYLPLTQLDGGGRMLLSAHAVPSEVEMK